jgi:hypothetical protein
MKKILLAAAFVASLLGSSSAQEKVFKNSWEIEVDPIAYALDGHSLHVIYHTGRWRFDAGSYGIKVPEGLQANKGYRLRNEGFGVKANYLLQGLNGFYTGIGIGYSDLEATFKETGEKKKGNSIGAGVNVGYRVFINKEKEGNRKGLYLTPWVGINYNFYPKEIEFSNREYKQEAVEFFPTVHIGYRF